MIYKSYKQRMKKMIVVLLMICLVVVVAVILTGCANNNSTNSTNTTAKSNNTATNTAKTNTVSNETTKEIEQVNYEESAKKQMAMPENGETIAIIKVKNFGDIKVKFFKDIAPKAVENFVTHAKEGYYNNLTFHRVIDEFMIQGGDPKGDGTGGESIWGDGFGTELDESLVPYRGSLCMAMSSLPNSIGSQFFITQANYSEQMETYMKKGGYPEDLLEQYKNYGGYLSLYMQYTVFGQVYEGMDIVDKIAKVQTNSNDKPLEDVVIETIEVSTYEAK